MKTIDNSKTSLVEFMASIKFARQGRSRSAGQCSSHFAGFSQRARTNAQFSAEDSQLIRSAN